ncbi:anaerobic dehydrogenase, typically selenocysteine-containing [Desulfosporosinus orientis DSM 765]|uniref:Anaerobic dehydrogenase, typically selenocysteine-containing n=1 Tax=Desulfosporosinus orientis (strain ATCC 19365 / DSM 765 / NCIMB 8382 / VKM B-1628 / Singapore I) TaxID=768706 RepID=G7W6A3_DESOD|nr:molybdopterin-dependent oxidoreductase [Desulfosporosinus orientis]AET68110.1 anaerobic dehydrogenase, typically selenocysteine-containing [Desulfosporosinus orientis DSM 765]
MSVQKHHHICPRNCYDTCSMISTTVNGLLVSVEGNPAHDYTKGNLCPKAMHDIKKVYSPERIKYPMRQKHRFSGDWERLSWDEALLLIAQSILDIKHKFSSTLPIVLNKYSGNFGALHNAIEWLFSGIGPTTRAVGSPCWSAGIDAQTFDFGRFVCSDPQSMGKAKLIWLWGVNPAWTAIHQMSVIFDAIDRGATVVCFDTHLSATAARSHSFIQVKPGTDGLLALAMCKVLAEENLIDPKIEDYSLGYQEFIAYLNSEMDLEKAAEITGVKTETIRELAREYGQTHPACIWVGFGLQRYSNGGQTLRAIDALGALAGHIGEEGGGVNYAHFETWQFSDAPSVQDQNTGLDRLLNINRFAAEALACTDPHLSMLWLYGRNPLAQDSDLKLWHQLVQQLDLIVINDLFLTSSAEAADIFLPVTTHYEHWDLNSSYWHYWVGVNEPAIPPVGETRSDLEIAWNVSAALNTLEPGSCTFPTHGSEKESVLKQLSPGLLRKLALNTSEEILANPIKAGLSPVAWKDRKFATPSGRFEFLSARAASAGFPALPIYLPAQQPPKDAPLRLLTPHHTSTINSQSYQADEIPDHYQLSINPELAQAYKLKEGDLAEIFNESGSQQVRVSLDPMISTEIVIVYKEAIEQKTPALNVLLKSNTTDMGWVTTGAPGLALNETFVNLRRI